MIETVVLEPFVWIAVWIARIFVTTSPSAPLEPMPVITVKETQVFRFGLGLFSVESVHVTHLITGYCVFGVLLYHYAVCKC